MKCYRKILCIRQTAHSNDISLLKELHIPQNWLCHFVECQKPKYFGHIKRHNGLEKTIQTEGNSGREKRLALTKMGEGHNQCLRSSDSGW